MDARRIPLLPDCDERPATAFAGLVAARLNDGTLRYSVRRRLLQHAENRGIGRFEANLIIATVQHQWRQSHVRIEPARQSCLPLIATFVILQSLVIIGLLVILCG